MKTLNQRLLFKLAPYPFLSMMGGWLYFVVERGLLGATSIYPATGNPYSSSSSFIGVTVLTFVMGSLLGALEEVYFKFHLKQYPFFIKLLIKTFLYVLIVSTLLLSFSFLLNSYNMGLPIFHGAVLKTIKSFFFSFTFLSIVLFSGAMISITLFFSEIVDLLGIDQVSSFFTGKYAKSVVEERIFMFLDMKGSTTIAEKLGHELHYQLINDYYADMTDAIFLTRGQIYQYVGDEIIIFWDARGGIERNQCLRCFFLIKEKIKNRSEHYLEHYQVVPQFKAGVHVGKVTRGQVGLIKRELLFTGDVLNTTARIQSLCNELKADLLISNELKEALNSDDFEFVSRGSFALKGRNKEATLLEVSECDHV